MTAGNVSPENELVQTQLVAFSNTLTPGQAFDLTGYLGAVLDNTATIVDGLGYGDLANTIKLYGFTLMHIAAAQTHVGGGQVPNDMSKQAELNDLILAIASDLDTANNAGGAR